MKCYSPLVFVIVICISGCLSKKTVTARVEDLPPKTSESVMKYDFASDAVIGYTKVNSTALFNDAIGFGFERGASLTVVNRGDKNKLNDGFVTSDKPFYFSIKLPEGNYHVKVILGDKEGTSDVAIRAECRRMMVNRVQTKKGELKTVEFTLHLRDTLIRSSNSSVHIKPREKYSLHWDNKLTLEFNGNEPKLAALEITPATSDVITVFLAGNSTVVDQAEEPYAAWGQMIPVFFHPKKVVVANYAESGESLSSFIAERRFEKILSLMDSGDYAFVEFGHNDMKQKGEGVGAFTSYKKDLKYFIAEVRKRRGIPVLVTSMQRRSFDNEGKIKETLGDYPEAVRQTAKEESVALIDLNAMSKIMYEAWGPLESIKAFVHFPPNTFPGQTGALNDNTHFTPFGAWQIAKIIVKGIVEKVPGLAKFIENGKPEFNPARPDSFASFYWPYSPSLASGKPDGN